MILRDGIQQSEPVSELCNQAFRRISSDLEAAAFRGAVRRKCRDNHKTSGAEGKSDLPDILPAIFLIGKKMEDGSIVPEPVHAMRERCAENVISDPVHL